MFGFFVQVGCVVVGAGGAGHLRCDALTTPAFENRTHVRQDQRAISLQLSLPLVRSPALTPPSSPPAGHRDRPGPHRQPGLPPERPQREQRLGLRPEVRARQLSSSCRSSYPAAARSPRRAAAQSSPGATRPAAARRRRRGRAGCERTVQLWAAARALCPATHNTIAAYGLTRRRGSRSYQGAASLAQQACEHVLAQACAAAVCTLTPLASRASATPPPPQAAHRAAGRRRCFVSTVASCRVVVEWCAWCV